MRRSPSSPRWSKLRSRVETLFSPAVAGRVGLHATRDRGPSDQDARSWITLDGREVVTMNSVVELAMRSLLDDLARPRPVPGGWRLCSRDEHADRLEEMSVFTQPALGEALHEYVNLSIDDILVSRNAIIRALGMLDRRLGRRRLRRLLETDDCPLVRRLLEFRCEAEGIAA